MQILLPLCAFFLLQYTRQRLLKCPETVTPNRIGVGEQGMLLWAPVPQRIIAQGRRGSLEAVLCCSWLISVAHKSQLVNFQEFCKQAVKPLLAWNGPQWEYLFSPWKPGLGGGKEPVVKHLPAHHYGEETALYWLSTIAYDTVI